MVTSLVDNWYLQPPTTLYCHRRHACKVRTSLATVPCSLHLYKAARLLISLCFIQFRGSKLHRGNRPGERQTENCWGKAMNYYWNSKYISVLPYGIFSYQQQWALEESLAVVELVKWGWFICSVEMRKWVGLSQNSWSIDFLGVLGQFGVPPIPSWILPTSWQSMVFVQSCCCKLHNTDWFAISWAL